MKKILLLVTLVSLANAECSKEDILSMTKAGYDSESIDKICEAEKTTLDNSGEAEKMTLDDSREGFYLALGIGFHSLQVEASIDTVDYSDSQSESFDGYTTSFNLGYAFTNNFLLYYVSDVKWFNDLSDELHTDGIGGIGFSYYQTDKLYWKAMYGLATNYQFDNSSSSLSGFGYEIGFGYEFIKHWSIEVDYTQSTYNEEIIDGETISLSENGISSGSSSVRAILKYHVY